jgi:acyl-CoA synthetase (AMP-forming)/AMP-acid ligase II
MQPPDQDALPERASLRHCMPHHGPPLAPLIDLTRLVEAGLGGDPAAAALQDLDHSLSWAELDRQVERLARADQRLGLRRGDRLASLIPNRVELVVHDLAGLRSGLVFTPLNYRYVPPEIDHALMVSGAAALVFHGERLADVQASAVADGWLDSGDDMRVDADGFFWFCGRRKHIIVHDSSNICPQEVEEALAEHPAVDRVGVIGIQDPVHGENVRACISLRHDQPAPSEAELIAFAPYKALEEIRVLAALPLTPVGKTDRLALRRLAAPSGPVAGGPAPGRPPDPAQLRAGAAAGHHPGGADPVGAADRAAVHQR